MSNAIEITAAGRRDSLDMITLIRQQADVLVRQVNPGRVHSGPAFSAKVTEVADAMTRKVCCNLTDNGRPDLARKIRIAWERTEAPA